MTWYWIVLLVVVSALALLPFAHRAWTRRRDAGEPHQVRGPVASPGPAVGPVSDHAASADGGRGADDEAEGGEGDGGVDGAGTATEELSAPDSQQLEPDVEVESSAPDEPVVEVAADHAVADVPEPEQDPPSFRRRLGKARRAMAGFVDGLRSRVVDDETWDALEEALIGADVGVRATLDAVERLRRTATERGIRDGTELLDALKEQMISDLAADRSLRREEGQGVPVWLFVGVNGVGKTTTIGKVGQRLANEGVSSLMAAGDTFRAAAAEQLTTWADRCGAEIVRGSEGADPSSVIFDGIQAASARNIDVVLADTAGRLQNKVNLMEELAKVRRVADREPGAVQEVLLVIDATTGQNGLSQAQQFAQAVDVSGVVLTKLDGSAKGGIVFAIERELGIPVKLVGLGESAADLVDFDPQEFVEALFAKDAS